MQSGQILNLEPKLSAQAEEKTPGLQSEINENRALIEQATFEVRQARARLDRQQDQQESQELRTKILSGVIGFLIVCLAGTVWWAYPTLRNARKVSGDMLSMQSDTNKLTDRVTSAEGNLRSFAGALPALSNRMSQLQATMKTNLQSARDQAQAAATQVSQRVREDLNKSLQLIQSRLTALESNQVEATSHVNQLQDEISGLKRELAAVREANLASAERIKELTTAQQTSRTDLSGLTEKVATSQAALHTLTNHIDRKRMDFNVQNRRTTSVAPGVALTVAHTNAGKQEIDGTLQAGSEAKSLTIRGQGVQKPFLFYLPGDTRAAELVFTQVSKNGVAGYVMMPAPEEQSAQ